MSNSDNNSPKPASDVNMSLPYAEQMAPLADALRAFMQGSGGHFMSMHDLSGDWPEHSKTEQVTPRSGVTAAVKRFIATARGAENRNVQNWRKSQKKTRNRRREKT